MNTTTIYHTSPTVINTINEHGRFGSFLFFSCDEYVMAGGEHVTYTIEIDEDELIDAGSLFYHEDASKLESLVAEFCKRFDVDKDTAEEVISERQELPTPSLEESYELRRNVDFSYQLADDSWDVQHYTARAAQMLGYRGVRVTDEQGGAYMIDMLNRENELKIVS